MHSYISEKKLQTDTVTITILGLRGFDIRAKGVDVLQAKVPFQALQSVKSSEDKSTLFDFIRCLFFFLFSIFFRCFFALWRLRGRCQHPVYKGSHEDDCACTTSCEALALESANVEIQRRLNSAASTMTDTVHFQRSNTSCHKSDVLLWHCRQPQRRMSARKMQLRLARLFEFWNQRVFLQRNVFACFCGNWRIPIFLFAYVIIPTQ